MATIPYHFKAKTLVDNGKTTQSAIDEIKNWIPSVQVPELCDEFIALLLLACRNVVEDTKRTIQVYFESKKNAPEMFADRDIDSEELEDCLGVVAAAEIPTRTEDNTAILMFRLKDTNYLKFNLAPAFKLSFMITELCQLSNPPDGVIVCLDMAGVGLMHLTRLKLSLLQKCIQFLEEGISFKLLGFYFLNANYVFDKLFKILKIFLSEELAKLVKPFPIGTSMEELANYHIPAQCLPKEYGGLLPKLDQLAEDTAEDLRKEGEYFAFEEKWRKSMC